MTTLTVPVAGEDKPPCGQAALWLEDVLREVSAPTAQAVARQLARLCGEDSSVTTTRRSLADAVGLMDKRHRLRAYSEAGVDVLVSRGWLRVEVSGRGCQARTTYFLLPGTGSHLPRSQDVEHPQDDSDDETPVDVVANAHQTPRCL